MQLSSVCQHLFIFFCIYSVGDQGQASPTGPSAQGQDMSLSRPRRQGEIGDFRNDCTDCLCSTYNEGGQISCYASVCGPCEYNCGRGCYCTAFRSSSCYWTCDYPGGLQCRRRNLLDYMAGDYSRK